MRFKSISILGRRYRIVPSLENMCNLEADTETNLIAGVNPLRVNLRFLRATIENIIEDEQGNHIDNDTLEKIYSSEIGLAQKVFLQCYREMYTLPKAEDKAVKKVIRRNKPSEKHVMNGSHQDTSSIQGRSGE